MSDSQIGVKGMTEEAKEVAEEAVEEAAEEAAEEIESGTEPETAVQEAAEKAAEKTADKVEETSDRTLTDADIDALTTSFAAKIKEAIEPLVTAPEPEVPATKKDDRSKSPADEPAGSGAAQKKRDSPPKGEHWSSRKLWGKNR